MAVSDGETITVVKDMGLVTTVFDERTLSGLPGAPGHRPHPLLHPRVLGLAQRPAGLPAGGPGRVRPRPQRQPDQHRRRWPSEAGMLPGWSPSDSDSWPSSLAQASRRRGPRRRGRGPRRGRRSTLGASRARCCPDGRGRVLAASSWTPPTSTGVRDPARASGPCASAGWARPSAPEGWVLASESPALDVVGATFVRELEPGELVIDRRRRRARPSSCSPAERDRRRTCASSSSSTSPGPTRRLYGREVHGARRRMGELLAEQAPVEADLVMGVPDSGVPAAEGYARRERHPLRPGPGEEPLHRPHLHHPGPAGPGRRGAAQAQPAAGEHRRQAPGGGRRLHRARHHHRGPSSACCATPAPPRSTCGSPRRRSAGPASTASTPPTATSCWPPTTTLPEIEQVPRASTRWPTSASTT